MDGVSPQIDSASIVLLGNFNPRIYQPAWFGAQGLIRPQEVEKAQIAIIRNEVADFTCDWLRIQVTQDRFYAGNTEAGHWQQLMDLVVGTFRILEHTPVRALGLNRGMHFPVSSEQAWHAIGDSLVPKDFWSSVMEGRSGLRSLTVLGKRPGAEAAGLNVKVEPSVQRAVAPHGVFVETNEHYDDAEAGGLSRLMETLAKNWEPALQHSLTIAQGILRLGMANAK
jgi:hypothetical protein